jgi:hypothetical protein
VLLRSLSRMSRAASADMVAVLPRSPSRMSHAASADMAATVAAAHGPHGAPH